MMVKVNVNCLTVDLRYPDINVPNHGLTLIFRSSNTMSQLLFVVVAVCYFCRFVIC